MNATFPEKLFFHEEILALSPESEDSDLYEYKQLMKTIKYHHRISIDIIEVIPTCDTYFRVLRCHHLIVRM